MDRSFRARLTACLCVAAAMPMPAQARVTLDSNMLVEQVSRDALGRSRLTLRQSPVFANGDRVVFVVQVRNAGPRPASGVVIVNPLPRAVVLQSVADPAIDVSSDGGRSWTRFDPVRTPRVTHMRWTAQRELAAGESSQFVYRGVIR